MRKFIVATLGAVLAVLLLVSSATAVPKVNSDPLMDVITEIEKNQKIIEEDISNINLNLPIKDSINLVGKKIKDIICNVNPKLDLGDLINLIIQIIQWLISILQKVISVITMLYNLVNLIYNLINLITTLYNLILDLIEFIKDLFNPQPLKAV